MVRELLSKLQSTSGGVKDTALNELTVSPTGVPLTCAVVTIVTPGCKFRQGGAERVSAGGRGVFKHRENLTQFAGKSRPVSGFCSVSHSLQWQYDPEKRID